MDKLSLPQLLDTLKATAKPMFEECFLCYGLLALIGAYVIFSFVWSIVSSLIWYTCKKRGVDTYRKYGKTIGVKEQKDKSWALVSGASDGIGLAYVKDLAARGFNIILLSRNADKLKRAED
jgi:hypothetical protein